MNFKNISIKKIKYIKNNLYYNGAKLIIQSPIMKCDTGIEKYFNKHIIKFELDMNDEENRLFYDFLKRVEENNKTKCNNNSTYRSQIETINKIHYFILKVPYRYNKYEIKINSDIEYLPTSSDIKKDRRARCEFQITKLWNYPNNNEMLSGCLMELKSITLLS